MEVRKIKSAKAIFDKETEAMLVIITECGDENSCIRDAMYTYSIAIKDYNNAEEFLSLQWFLKGFDLNEIVIYSVKENKRYEYCIDKLILMANVLGFNYCFKKELKK